MASSSPPDLFDLLSAALRRGERRIAIGGLMGASRAWLLARLIRAKLGPIVCVVGDEDAAEALAQDLGFFLPNAEDVVRVADDDPLPYDAIAPERQSTLERLAALHRIRRGRARAIVVSARAIARRYLPPDRFDAFSERITIGSEFDRDRLAARLVEMGYENAPVVEDVGTFAVRGGLVDLWSPLHDRPVRVDLFGDLVESVRPFDLESQRTLGTLDTVELCPAREVLFDAKTQRSATAAIRELADALACPSAKIRELLDRIEERHLAYGMEALLPGFFDRALSPLTDYLASPDPVFFLDDPDALADGLTALDEELAREFAASRERQELTFEPDAYYLTLNQVRESLAGRRMVLGGALRLASPDTVSLSAAYDATRELRQEILAHHGEHGALSPLVSRLNRWREAGLFTAIACGSSGQVDRLRRLLLDRNVMTKAVAGPLPEDPAKAYDPSVAAHLFTGGVSAGFVDPAGRLAVVSEDDVFGQKSRKAARRARPDQPFVAAFRELKEGDLVVHVDYGIGRYAGLVKMSVRGVSGDVLVIEYAGKDKVYLPVARLRLLQKFAGSDAENIALDRLGGNSWEKRKKSVKERLLKMAAELLRIYAARRAHPGHAFSPPDEYFRQFEADFPFEETVDQARAIEEVLADMQREEPMDRLVCGDVGYGKTEVALRAAFKAALDKKQIAVLVPTTILAAQHLRTFRERFKDYPVNVEMVSSMHTAQVNREILRRTSQGEVDLLIGTHRLLNADVSFKDLGLLIVDEEQRFGVAHKEKLKRWRTQVDVLTLTATPIPRTLHLSMSGMRDMSIIASPPADRKSIRTFVMKFDAAQVAEAIRRELARGGQIYFVHNRVESIESIRKLLAELVPEARFAVAHGQMHEGALEKVMAAFVAREHDVLISTSIIESGLDIPSANTLIVDRADHFGLAQLYQIRGRVGRSRERAYAYLFVPAHKPVSRDAEKRLEVLQSFTELGAGFSIASHDLEIRGAGNLLGPDQSGQIAAVGFDLYAQLLDEAVRELRGEPLNQIIDPDVTVPLPAYIPDFYLPDVPLRLVFYKRFAQVQGDEELNDLKTELIDRFGDLPDEVETLARVMSLKAALRRLRIRQLDIAPGRLVFTLGNEAELDPNKLMGLVARSKGAWRLTPEMKAVTTYDATSKSAEAMFAACDAALGALFRCEREVLMPLNGMGPKWR